MRGPMHGTMVGQVEGSTDNQPILLHLLFGGSFHRCYFTRAICLAHLAVRLRSGGELRVPSEVYFEV